MKGNYSKTWQIGHSFLISHFLTDPGKIPINCVHFRLSNSLSTYSAIPKIYCHKHKCFFKIRVIPAISVDVAITGLKLE